MFFNILRVFTTYLLPFMNNFLKKLGNLLNYYYFSKKDTFFKKRHILPKSSTFIDFFHIAKIVKGWGGCGEVAHVHRKVFVCILWGIIKGTAV